MSPTDTPSSSAEPTACDAVPQPSGKTRVILELGTGNDLHGSDYTKAALRAVQDALHHSSLSFIRSLGVDKSTIDVEVTIGVQAPDRVDLAAVKASLPVGNVTVKAVLGGLDIADPDNNDPAVIASAAIAVRIPVEAIRTAHGL